MAFRRSFRRRRSFKPKLSQSLEYNRNFSFSVRGSGEGTIVVQQANGYNWNAIMVPVIPIDSVDQNPDINFLKMNQYILRYIRGSTRFMIATTTSQNNEPVLIDFSLIKATTVPLDQMQAYLMSNLLTLTTDIFDYYNSMKTTYKRPGDVLFSQRTALSGPPGSHSAVDKIIYNKGMRGDLAPSGWSFSEQTNLYMLILYGISNTMFDNGTNIVTTGTVSFNYREG